MTEQLDKVYFDLPNHWATGGESMWAKRAGHNLYELRNVPFYAYGVNYLDVVLATADSADAKAQVRSVHAPSGHATLRVFFSEGIAPAHQLEHLDGLSGLNASLERATARYLTIDIDPAGNLAAVRAMLDGLENAGILAYETTEARVPGSFDGPAQV